MVDEFWPRVLRRTAGRALARINVVVPTSTRGKAVSIPFIGGRSLHAGAEPWMTDLLGSLLPLAPGRFVDVGVNLGQTLLKVKLLDPERAYLGFEPNPLCVSYVRELIARNHWRSVELVPAGLFVRDEILALELFSTTDATDSAASVISNFRPGQPVHERLHVPVVRWETATKAVGEVPSGIVKIDVEGAELEVLSTMEAMIGRDMPLILMEVLPAYRADNSPRIERQRAIEALAARHGYSILRVQKSSDGRFRGLRRIQEFGVHADLNECEHVLAPARSAQALAHLVTA